MKYWVVTEVIRGQRRQEEEESQETPIAVFHESEKFIQWVMQKNKQGIFNLNIYKIEWQDGKENPLVGQFYEGNLKYFI